MTPKEKAIELINKFKNELNYIESDYKIDLYRDIKQCALIAVDEILNATGFEGWDDTQMFWQQIKHEIEKL